jgi:hypothetical protein
MSKQGLLSLARQSEQALTCHIAVWYMGASITQLLTKRWDTFNCRNGRSRRRSPLPVAHGLQA